ncbi:hypothetical protein SMKI_16G2260 [Saccharomyces mikatae IFO 1815]|uniref:HMG box domain-containing protein n=1 Tax=Saccharomyces mikatae IFO 1815 TaxID=226126 RepID=A0AA35IU21_SACMI|nr:uncharacterized protein SMKI_16G2260 [Saccharomyces mikatae IFO 1815]CAI4036929.1 hypothetical protein SMKI_16G2260 [Saccharomyces mikatae IFO 1815]
MNPKSSTPKIPRPKNAFILFRQHYHRILIDEWTAQGVEIPHNSNISKIIGTKWKGLQPEEKAHWEDLAKKEKLEHERKYPEYKYKPIRKSKKKQLLLKEVEEQQQQQTQQAQTQPQPQLQQPFNNNIVLMKRAHSLSPSSSVSSSNSYQFQLNNDFRRLPIPSVSSPNYMVSRPLNGLPLAHDKAVRDLPQLSSQFHSIPHYSAPHDSATRHHYLNIAQAQPRANSTPQLPLISSIINSSNQTSVTNSTATTTTTATSSPSKLSSSPNSSIFENNRLNSINNSNQYLPPPLLPSLQDFQLDQYQQLKQMGPTYIVKPLSHTRNNLLSTTTPTHHHIPHIPNQNIPLHQIINSNNEVTAKTSLVSPK